MKELGNLAIVCARRPDVLMQIYDGMVSVHADFGSTRSVLYTTWDNEIGRATCRERVLRLV